MTTKDRAIELARQAGFTYGLGRADIEKFNRLYQLARNDALTEGAAKCRYYGGFKEGYVCAGILEHMKESS